MTAGIAWFDELGRGDVRTAGRKGANLGEMTRAGLPVPPGFVITTGGFCAFLQGAPVGALIDREMPELEGADAGARERIAEIIQREIRAASLPRGLRGSILAAYRELAARDGGALPLVAVRSSALVDGEGEPVLGELLLSMLNVRGEEELLRAVQRCWASLSSAEALTRLEEHGLRLDRAAIAVVVQTMIEAEKWGKLFTEDPLSGDPTRIVIEADWGLRETIAAGREKSDHYVVDKRSLEMIERYPSPRRLQAPDATEVRGSLGHGADPRRRDEWCLNQAELLKLAELAIRDEVHYGAPQEVEFAVAEGSVYLVRTSAMTPKRSRRTGT